MKEVAFNGNKGENEETLHRTESMPHLILDFCSLPPTMENKQLYSLSFSTSPTPQKLHYNKSFIVISNLKFGPSEGSLITKHPLHDLACYATK